MADTQQLIAQVVREVLDRLGIEQSGEKKPGTLAVFTGYVFNKAPVSAYLEKKGNVTCALFGEAAYHHMAFDYANTVTGVERQRLAQALERFESVVVVTPPLSYIQRVASADDGDFACMLALRPLLWGKSVTLLLDFTLPRSRRGFAALSDSLERLEQMGMRIETVQSGAPEGRRQLVTEQDIKDAARHKRESVRITPDAIVTALARDTAKELGIRIEL